MSLPINLRQRSSLWKEVSSLRLFDKRDSSLYGLSLVNEMDSARVREGSDCVFHWKTERPKRTSPLITVQSATLINTGFNPLSRWISRRLSVSNYWLISLFQIYLVNRPVKDADLCQDSHWQDHYSRGRGLRHYWKCQGQDPGKI